VVSGQPSPRERIAEAGLALIAEKGLVGVTMTAVAERAGVARQTLYNHFPDVESIITAVVEQHERWGSGGVGRLLEGHPDAGGKLEQLIRHSVATSVPAPASLEGSLSPRAQEALREHRNQAHDLIVQILREGLSEGSFRADLVPEIDAALIQKLLVSAGDSDEADDPARQVGAVVRFVLAAVGAGPG